MAGKGHTDYRARHAITMNKAVLNGNLLAQITNIVQVIDINNQRDSSKTTLVFYINKKATGN
ncbi:hypothetical protein [Aeromonas salmonicida]|uniref:hypothetical protein n=1 Tax=Aeromonas salmonicida TaxID=645 RepID=UPI0038B8BAD2